MSFFHQIDSHWDVVGTAQFTRWSVEKNLIINHSQPDEVPVINNLNYKDSWFYSLGADYKLNQQWRLKMGLGYDQTPTQDGYRDMRLPGADRIAVSTGAHWVMNKSIDMDFAYQHLFINKAKVDDSQRSGHNTTGYMTDGTAHMKANLFGVSVSINL